MLSNKVAKIRSTVQVNLYKGIIDGTARASLALLLEMPGYPQAFSNLSGDFRNPEILKRGPAQIEALTVVYRK